MYWVRSPHTNNQWLAVRSLDGHLTGQPDLFAVLNADGWQLFTREPEGNYRQTHLPARAGLAALPGPVPAAVTNIVVSELRQYNYDPNGNLTYRLTPERFDQYGHDALDRLNNDNFYGQTPRVL